MFLHYGDDGLRVISHSQFWNFMFSFCYQHQSSTGIPSSPFRVCQTMNWRDKPSLTLTLQSFPLQPPPPPAVKLVHCTSPTRATCPTVRAFSVAWAGHRRVWTRWTISCALVRMLIRRIWRYKSYKFTTTAHITTENKIVHPRPLNKVHFAQKKNSSRVWLATDIILIIAAMTLCNYDTSLRCVCVYGINHLS